VVVSHSYLVVGFSIDCDTKVSFYSDNESIVQEWRSLVEERKRAVVDEEPASIMPTEMQKRKPSLR